MTSIAAELYTGLLECKLEHKRNLPHSQYVLLAFFCMLKKETARYTYMYFPNRQYV